MSFCLTPGISSAIEPSVSWGCSSAGRARRSQRRGQGFDPPHLHHVNINLLLLQWVFCFKAQITHSIAPVVRIACNHLNSDVSHITMELNGDKAVAFPKLYISKSVFVLFQNQSPPRPPDIFRKKKSCGTACGRDTYPRNNISSTFKIREVFMENKLLKEKWEQGIRMMLKGYT